MTVWTHDLLDALRQIGDPPLDDEKCADEVHRMAGGPRQIAPRQIGQLGPGSGSSAPGVGLADGSARPA